MPNYHVFDADETKELEQKRTLRKRQARGCLIIVFAVSVILSLVSLIPNVLNTVSDFLEEIGLSIPLQVETRLQESLRGIALYGITGTAILFVYIIGKIAGHFAKIDDEGGTQRPVSQNPISVLVGAVLTVFGHLFNLISVLADAIEEITEGLLESFEYLYNVIEQLLEYDLVRWLVFGVYFILFFSWSFFTAFFVSKYLLTGSLQWALWMLGAASLTFFCQVFAIATLRKRQFRKLALQQLRLLSNAGSFILLLYIPFYYLLTRLNSFFTIGPITKIIILLFISLFLFELGRRMQQSVKRRQ